MHLWKNSTETRHIRESRYRLNTQIFLSSSSSLYYMPFILHPRLHRLPILPLRLVHLDVDFFPVSIFDVMPPLSGKVIMIHQERCNVERKTFDGIKGRWGEREGNNQKIDDWNGEKTFSMCTQSSFHVTQSSTKWNGIIYNYFLDELFFLLAFAFAVSIASTQRIDV